MAIDASVPRTRRALLAGGIGSLVALVASALGRPVPADAASGVFDSNIFATPAVRATHTAGGDGVYAATSALGAAVFGRNPDGTGVYGWTTSGTGVWGWTTSGVGVYGNGSSGIGVHGSNSSGIGVRGNSIYGDGVRGSSVSGDGVVGDSGGSNKSGVYGFSTVADGYGVFGRNTATGATGFLGGRSAEFPYHPAGVMGISDSGYGVVGESQSGNGVTGFSHTGAAVSGNGYIAVFGYGRGKTKAAIHGWSGVDSTGVWGLSGGGPGTTPAKTGVYGYAIQDASARGVYGYSTAGRGVYGQATTGTGLYGQATTGYAIRAVGRVKLDKCAGVATILTTKSSVVVTPGIDLVSTSAVVATLMGNAGGGTTVKRVAVNTTANTFTIYLTANATANVRVAWHVFG